MKIWNEEQEKWLAENYRLLGAKLCARQLGFSILQIKYKLEKIKHKILPAPADQRTCSTCEQIKKLDDFYKARKGRDGLHAMCIQCFNDRDRVRFAEDMSFRFLKNMRRRFKFICGKSFSKDKEKIIGAPVDVARAHLEKQFSPLMGWHNYGKGKLWEVDHIVPVSLLLEKRNEGKENLLFNYRNLRPLTIKENSIKSNNLEMARDCLLAKINTFGADPVYLELLSFLEIEINLNRQG